MKKQFLLVSLFALMISGLAVPPFAQAVTAQTWVKGTVRDGSGQPLTGRDLGTVTVQCGERTRTRRIKRDGTYEIHFSQLRCEVGDPVIVTAHTPQGSGSGQATVPETDLTIDVVVVDITVPELGLIGGLVAGLGSIGGYLWLRAKAV